MSKKYGSYSKTFSLRQIFNNYNLRKVLPQVNYKDFPQDNGKIKYTTNLKNINSLVYETAKNSARPFYKPLKASKNGNIIILDGVTESDLSEIVDTVYNDLLGTRQMMIFTVNNMGVVRDALKESEQNKFLYGKDNKIYLRVKSNREIEQMTKHQLYGLMENIMENIFYNDAFIKTREKYHLDKVPVNSAYSYDERKAQWERRVKYNG